MAEDNRGPLDPVQPAPSPPVPDGETPPHNNGPSLARAENPPAPAADRTAAGPPAGAPNTQVKAANGQRVPAPVPALKTSTGTGDKPTPHEIKDGFREIIETIVFVVVLVLMLKSFLAEAFVIPTGSMATTLLGYHQNVECPQCGYKFRINMSIQLDAAQQNRAPVTGCTCQNCQLPFNLPLGPKEGGPP